MANNVSGVTRSSIGMRFTNDATPTGHSPDSSASTVWSFSSTTRPIRARPPNPASVSKGSA